MCVVFLILIFYFQNDFLKKDREVVYVKLKKSRKLSAFNYVIENSCGVTSKLAVILVTSYMGNVEVRSAMRRAFPAEKLKELNLTRIFLLGVAPNEKFTSQSAILNEDERFGDILQGDFNEAYRNLTYKHLMGLKWASNCQNFKYVIKMDDDIVVNFYKIADLLKDSELPSDLLAGYILKGLTPIREPANKWYVTTKEYENSIYPTFVSGWFYVTNPQTCEKLIDVAESVSYFWIDDIYITGILAQEIELIHYNLGQYVTVHPEFLRCCMNDVEKSNLDCEVLIGPNGGDNNLFFDFNQIIRRCYYKTCHKRTKSLNQTCVAEKKFSLGQGSSEIETYRLT